MSLFKRGKTWYEFWFAGRRLQESAKTGSKTIAKQAEQKRRRELEEGFNRIEDHRDEGIRTIRDVEKDYLEGYALRNRSATFADYAVGHVTRLLGTKMLVDVDEQMVIWYQGQRLKEKAAPKTMAVRQLFQRQDLSVPSHVINTSPDKWQVTWRVQGFGKTEAAQLQRALVRETGADPAATDCARVLRLPSFFNHKYARPHLVRVEPNAGREGLVYRPDRFPRFAVDERSVRHPFDPSGRAVTRKHPPGHLSQSERDWPLRNGLARAASLKRSSSQPSPATGATTSTIPTITRSTRYEKRRSRYDSTGRREEERVTDPNAGRRGAPTMSQRASLTVPEVN